MILANWLTERRKERRGAEEREDRNAALMTAVFVVRNFIVEALNQESNPAIPSGRRLGGLKSAQRNLDAIIEKSPPEVQYIMSTIFGMSLRLGDLITAMERSVDHLEIELRIELLYRALEDFDIVSGQDLEILSADDLRGIVSNPEDVPE